MRAKDLMVELSPGVYHRASLGQVSQALVQYDAGAVLILADDGSMLGIVTDGDLFRRRRCANHSFLECWLEHLGIDDAVCRCRDDASHITAETVMSRPVISVPEDTKLTTVAALLMQHGIRRVPVTRDGQPVGMLGRRDVLRALLSCSGLSAPACPSSAS